MGTVFPSVLSHPMRDGRSSFMFMCLWARDALTKFFTELEKFGVSNGELMVRRHRLTDQGRLHAKHAERSTTKLFSPHASPSHFGAGAGSLGFRVL